MTLRTGQLKIWPLQIDLEDRAVENITITNYDLEDWAGENMMATNYLEDWAVEIWLLQIMTFIY